MGLSEGFRERKEGVIILGPQRCAKNEEKDKECPDRTCVENYPGCNTRMPFDPLYDLDYTLKKGDEKEIAVFLVRRW